MITLTEMDTGRRIGIVGPFSFTPNRAVDGTLVYVAGRETPFLVQEPFDKIVALHYSHEWQMRSLSGEGV